MVEEEFKYPDDFIDPNLLPEDYRLKLMPHPDGDNIVKVPKEESCCENDHNHHTIPIVTDTPNEMIKKIKVENVEETNPSTNSTKTITSVSSRTRIQTGSMEPKSIIEIIRKNNGTAKDRLPSERASKRLKKKVVKSNSKSVKTVKKTPAKKVVERKSKKNQIENKSKKTVMKPSQKTSRRRKKINLNDVPEEEWDICHAKGKRKRFWHKVSTEYENSGVANRQVIPMGTSLEENIILLYGFHGHVNVPWEMVKFYKFCKFLRPKKPTLALIDLDIMLVGPFALMEFIDREMQKAKELVFLAVNEFHLFNFCRLPFDDPNVQTTMIYGKDCLGKDNKNIPLTNMGSFACFRDTPSEEPIIVEKKRNCDEQFNYVANDHFRAFIWYLYDRELDGQMGKIMKQEKIKLPELTNNDSIYFQKKLMEFVQKEKYMTNFLDANDDGTTTFRLPSAKRFFEYRRKDVVSNNIFHGLGMKSPYHETSQVEYKELPVDPVTLREMFHKFIKNDEDAIKMMQFIQDTCEEANKDMVFGMTYEFLLQLFYFNERTDKFHEIMEKLWTDVCEGMEYYHELIAIRALFQKYEYKKNKQLNYLQYVRDLSCHEFILNIKRKLWRCIEQ
ncbi:hypothetical protein SNEBB_009571 [Seison nebaliae]|nr:hypothetical protein SNEBB_009571 [Seison nebaliae]